MPETPQPPQPGQGLTTNVDGVSLDVQPADATIAVSGSGVAAGQASATQQAQMLKFASLRG